MQSIIPSIFLLLLIGLSPLAARPQFEVTSPQNRQQSANQHLSGQANQIAVYTKGLVCSSCGIGLRVHLKKLTGIDKNAFKQGIHLDASKQLIVLAYQAGEQPDPQSVRSAIENAGYEAVHYYQWDGEQVRIHSFGDSE